MKLTDLSKKEFFEKTFKIFDWIYYTEYYNEVTLKNIDNKLDAWNEWYNNMEKHHFFKLQKVKVIKYKNFDWVMYTSLNEDLAKMNRSQAWEHWINHGSKEYRPLSGINSTCIHRARFGNLFFVNMAFHFIALQSDLHISYKYYKQFKELGINFYIGKKKYDNEIYLTEQKCFDLIRKNESIEKNIFIDITKFYCQKKHFCLFLKEKFNTLFSENVRRKNLFKHRYDNNDDVFIHVRLGDLKDTILKDLQKNKNQSESNSYYEKALSTMTFGQGYISSDSIDSEFCQSLIKKYKLKVIDLDEVKTIMFASTCKNLILSGGTFSWMMGFFAFYSENIYYPKKKNTWYDDIFVFDNWNGIDE